MTTPTVALTIVSGAITGAPLANGSVVLQLTEQDVVIGSNGLVVSAAPVTVPLDANGMATVQSFPNTLGTRGTQTKATFFDSNGIQQGQTALATIPNAACNLHDVIDLDPPPALSSAQIGVNLARLWAMLTGSKVDGVEWAAKEYAQGSQAGTGGSAMNWAQFTHGQDVPGAVPGSRSAMSWSQDAQGYASAASTSASQAASSATQTSNDRTQTGLDRAQCDSDLTQVQSLQMTATAAAASAYASSLSAASVAQQDLSGIPNGAALHRGPGSIVGMCLIDTSKDSEGGAWVEKCGNLSYIAGETLNGAYIGPPAGNDSELIARARGGTLSNELLSATPTWSAGFGTTASTFTPSGNGGTLTVAGADTSPRFVTALTGLTINAVYLIGFSISGGNPSAGPDCYAVFTSASNGTGGSQSTAFKGTAGQRYAVLQATATTMYLGVNMNNATAGNVTTFNGLSVKQVQAFATSGSLYPNAGDGKFYRLWKNLLQYSEQLNNAAWVKVGTAPTITDNYAVGPNGTQVSRLQFTASGTGNRIQQVLSGAGSGSLSGQKTISFRMKGEAGGEQINVWNGWSDLSQNITLTTAWQQFTFPFNATNSSSGLYLSAVAGTPTVQICESQYEVGGAANSYELKTSDSTQTEVFRGSKAKPGRGMLTVAESVALTIFDPLDTGRPMWMRFVGNVANNAIRGTINSVQYKDGWLIVGTSNGVTLVNFANDTILWYSVAGLWRYRGKIADRNAGLGWDQVDGTKTIASATVNAVAVCQIPEAPVDPVSGLAAPLVVLGTASGLSMILPDGTVRNSAATNNITSVAANPYVMLGTVSGSTTWLYALSPASLGASFATTSMTANNPPGLVFPGVVLGGAVMAGRGTIAMRSSSTARVGIMRFNESAPGASIEAQITDTSNTGGLIGDIKRAFLCDTVAGTVTGGDLITYGDFNSASDVAQWTAWGSATLAYDATNGGRLQITGGGGNSGAYRAIATVPGMWYAVYLTVANGTDNGQLRVGTTAGGNDLASTGTLNTASSPGVFAVFRATTTTSYVTVANSSGTAGLTVFFDTVRTYAVVVDRSYKASRLTVNGAITFTAVAAAAQMVAASGWSATNYLQEQNSADYGFGTSGGRVSVYGSLPVTTGSITPAPGGVGPAINYLPLANFPLTNIPLTMNGAQWTKGTGWAATGANSFTLDGSAGAAQTNFQMVSGQFPTTGTVRKWTLTITALNLNGGSLNVFANQSSTFFNITQPGTYTGLGDGNFAFLRASGGTGVTCTGTLQIDELDMACAFDYSSATPNTPFWRAGCNALGALVTKVSDGTTTRVTVSSAYYATGQRFKMAQEYATSGTLSLKVNGQPNASTTGTPLGTLTNASAVFTVGNSQALNAAWPGDLCMVKVTATIPSADAGTWIYELEKEMFQPGAQVTLPDSGSVVDISYDAKTNELEVVSAAYESRFVGFVRTAANAVSAGSFSKCAKDGGIVLTARSTTNPGVDITVPAQNLKEELLRSRAEEARKEMRPRVFDWQGAFTATTTNGSAQLTAVSGLTVPAGCSLVGARVSGTGIQAGTTILSFTSTTVELSLPCTAGNAGITVSIQDFFLPTGWESESVLTSGAAQQEGATKTWQRAYTGFREAVQYGSVPGNNWVQIKARRVLQ